MVDKQMRGAEKSNGEQPTMAAEDAGAGPKVRKASAAKGPKAGGSVKQLSAIFDKGLGVVDATLDLGLTVLNRVGGFALERMGEGPDPQAASPNGPEAGLPEGADQGGPFDPGAAQGTVPQEPGYFITNRLPVTTNDQIKIPFSINNDSMVERKTVILRVEGFVGEMEGGLIIPEGFAIKPAKKTIAACDFARFELLGSMPPDTKPDIYQGSVVVESGSGEAMSIPVRLVIG